MRNYITVNIEKPMKTLYDEIIVTKLILKDIATFNAPARIRMTTLFAIPCIAGSRVALTCNLNEGVCENKEIREKIDRLHELNLHKANFMPTFRLEKQ